MSGHGHTCSHAHHDHAHDDEEGGEAWSLYTKVDPNQCIALNEALPNSLPNILRAWHQRCDPTLPTLRSDADEQLLLKIAFVTPVNIRSLCFIGSGDMENPATVKAFVNVEIMDFPLAETKKSVQTFQLVERNVDGAVEYPTKYTRFQNVSTLWLFISHNFGADYTDIRYLGFKGTYTNYKREAVHTVYESRPMKAAGDVKNTKLAPMGQ